MKQTVFGFIVAMISLLFVVLQLNVNSRDTRQSETNDSLSQAVETTMKNVLNEGKYTFDDKEEFIADCLQGLATDMTTNSDIVINMIEADKEKGYVSVEVIETFENKDGEKSTTKCVKNIVFDDMTVIGTEVYRVNFYVAEGDSSPYKSYKATEGKVCVTPAELPADLLGEGNSLTGWKAADGSTAGVGEVITPTADMDYFAVVN